MAEIEKKAAKNAKRLRIQNILLASLYVTGAVTLGVLAPNAVRLIQYVAPSLQARSDKASDRMSKALWRMRASGLIRRHPNGSFELTDRGRGEAARLHLFYAAKSRRAHRWDKRWRIVMFDIWEKRTNVRRQLRTMLEQIGFVQLQKSVWVYPYDCEDVIALLRTDLRLGKGLLYFVADGADNDTELRRQFGLAK